MNKFQSIIVIFSIFLSFSCFANQCDNSIHVDYTKVLSITGFIKSKIFYGPPNFGDDEKNDTKYTGYMILLDSPICIYAIPFESLKHSNILIREINVRPEYKIVKYHFTDGGHVVAIGTLREASMPSDHTPVVLEVSDIHDEQKQK